MTTFHCILPVISCDIMCFKTKAKNFIGSSNVLWFTVEVNMFSSYQSVFMQVETLVPK
jgi:hypothetical protein